MPWKRVGECPPEQCGGDCCKRIGLWYDDTPDARLFLGTLAIRGVEVTRVGDKHLVDLPQTCQFLTEQGRCGIYNQPERPQFCADWPIDPSQLLLHPHCGFRFEWVEELSPAGAS